MNRLLILDLDETLIHTETAKESDYYDEGVYDFKFPIGGGGWSSEPTYWYFTRKRPFLKEFMDYAFNNFKVAIWTASSPDYASIVLENSGIPIKNLDFFWTRERCTMKYDYEKMKHYGVKTLNKVHKSFGYNLENILIVDDIAETAINNYGNLIHIKPFVYQTDDTELLKLMSYLETIKDEQNYRSIDKRGWSSKS